MSIEIIKLDQLQTVCTVKDDKGKNCWGHLKEYLTAPQELIRQLPVKHKLYRCRRCLTIYTTPAQNHLHVSKDGTVLPPQTDEVPEKLS